ncbi:MAG: hypothetical protein U1E06_14350 [Tabrizicola sp.]|uniref:hypothetical protein n=1 Tax=Tabrizicola sp. TaxID=2005166 RepID=UPI0027375AC7|nr:hypothetical protein [Tabrizicola sp.]MDP3263755.1 hypothetical protein [Tabrizicola sp.]MDP3647119.1 hypothetical protein [Paracoccaceae bacterium]MDZ4068005.1 hypothetical protein [Tabrizicola sp.]
MIGDSKILTVSYGTFSCTLEGFDDPLNTMKAIAEYFRDLASDDRYFGAEPPTPDAAMLHRIAEREVSRMVEARVQDNSVFLRQHDAPSQVAAPVAPIPAAAKVAAPTPAAPAPAAPAPAAPTPPAPSAPAAPVAEAPVTTADQPAKAAPEADLPVLHDVIPGGVAAKLARIRQAVSYHPTPAPQDEDLDLPVTPESAPVAEAPAPVLDAEEDYLPEDFAADLAPANPAPADLADANPAPADLASADLASANPAPANPAPVDFTPAARDTFEDVADIGLQADIAAEASVEAQVDPDEMPALVLTDSVPDEDPEDKAGVDDMVARLGLLLDDRDDEDESAAAAPEPMLLLADALVIEEDDTLEDLAALDGVAINTADDTIAPITKGQDDGPATLEPLADRDDLPPAAELEELYDEDEAAPAMAAEATFADGFVAETTVTETVAKDDLATHDLAAESLTAESTTEATAEATAESTTSDPADGDADTAPKRANARVIRIRRAEGEDGDDDVSPADDPTRPFDSAGEAVALSRLMRQADDEMAGAENRRRLSAIAHLKAAVAATEAERAVTGEALTSPTAKIGPYLDDLAHAVQPEEEEPSAPVVRPRREVSVRPQPSQRPGIRPGMMTAPPLVLVSEQRIDRTPPAGQPMVAVRPGRLSNAIGASAASHAPVADDQYAAAIAEFDEDEDGDTDNIFSDDAGFAEFVEQLGVSSLTERLEAAAAYATIVENRDSFTRPQLMRRLTGGPAGITPSREDGLRSFGTLLRTGKIEKVRRGQYTLASDSPYLAEARRLAL